MNHSVPHLIVRMSFKCRALERSWVREWTEEATLAVNLSDRTVDVTNLTVQQWRGVWRVACTCRPLL